MILQPKPITDGMFKGIYNGKQYHEADTVAVLNRAWSAGVDRIIVNTSSWWSLYVFFYVLIIRKKLDLFIHASVCCVIIVEFFIRSAYSLIFGFKYFLQLLLLGEWSILVSHKLRENLSFLWQLKLLLFSTIIK